MQKKAHFSIIAGFAKVRSTEAATERQLRGLWGSRGRRFESSHPDHLQVLKSQWFQDLSFVKMEFDHAWNVCDHRSHSKALTECETAKPIRILREPVPFGAGPLYFSSPGKPSDMRATRPLFCATLHAHARRYHSVTSSSSGRDSMPFSCSVQRSSSFA